MVVLSGHGIKAVAHGRTLGDMELRPSGRSPAAFPTVAAVTNSALWEGEVTLQELWMSLPTLEGALGGSRVTAREPLLLWHSDDEQLGASGYALFRASVWDDYGLLLEEFRGGELERDYPGLTGLTMEPDPDPESQLLWITRPAETGGLQVIDSAVHVSGTWYMRPRVGSGDTTPSELITWWAILYGLSSVARYEPEVWSAALDIDRSGSAVDLETALALAQRWIPELILCTLDKRYARLHPFGSF